jgi:hypothetical protein
MSKNCVASHQLARTIDVLEREYSYSVRLAFSKKGALQGLVSAFVLQ